MVPKGYNILSGGQTAPIIKGEAHPRNTLTNKQVEEAIDYLLFSSLSQREIAKIIGTTERVINSINRGETHKIEDYSYPLRKKFCHYSQKTLEQIYLLLNKTDASLDSIGSFFGLTKGNISQINLGKIHKIDNKVYPLRDKVGIP